MKHILFFILLFVSAPVFGQTLYTTGVTFCAGVPVHNPGTTGAKWALDTTTWNLYVRSYGTTWTLIGNNWIQNISGCAAPAYTPTKHQSKVVINACDPPELYAWDGAAWDQIGAGSGGLTGTGLATRIAAWTASGALGYDVNMVLDTVNNRMGVNEPLPARTLDVEGEARISDLTTDAPTRLIGADADGDLNEAGSGLANRLAYWTGTGRVGYGEAFSVDTTNKRLSILGSLASNAMGVRVRNTSSSGVSYYEAYNNTSLTSTDRILLGVGGTAASTGGITLNSGLLQIGSNLARLAFVVENSSSFFEWYFGGVSSTNKFATLSTNGFALSKSLASDAVFHSITNTSSSGFTQMQLYNNSGTTTNDGVVFGLAGTGVGAFDLAQAGYFTTRPNLNKLILATQGTSPIFFRTGGLATTNTKFSIEGDGDVVNGNFTASARVHFIGTGATSATTTLRIANSNDSIIIAARNDRRVGINTATPDVSLDAGDNTDAIKIPSGTTAQEPAVNNTLRFNTDRESLDARENGVMFRLTSSKTPSIAAGAAAGTGPTIAVAGNDLSMKVTLTTGTSATTGALFTVTYASSMDAGVTNYPVFSCADVDCTGLNLYVSAESNTAFTISTQNAPTDAVQYIINIHIGQ